MKYVSFLSLDFLVKMILRKQENNLNENPEEMLLKFMPNKQKSKTKNKNKEQKKERIIQNTKESEIYRNTRNQLLFISS